MTDDEISVLDEQGNVRWIKPYTPDNPPGEGDIAWVYMPNGTRQIVGRFRVTPELLLLREEFDNTDQSESIENGTVVEEDEE